MKNKIIYFLVFGIVFAGISGGILYMNKIYNNIFRFDFSPPHIVPDYTQIDKKTDADKNAVVQENIINPQDTININENDSTAVIQANASLIDSIKSLNNLIEMINGENNSDEAVKHVPDKAKYDQWVKKTAKLYETMEAGKVAKIIQNYSDNIAKDIIYSMKSKKAAEVLSEISPESASRITRVQ